MFALLGLAQIWVLDCLGGIVGTACSICLDSPTLFLESA